MKGHARGVVLAAWTVLSVVVSGDLAAGLVVAQEAQAVVVLFDTDKGMIEIEVDVARAPVTSENFLRYVDGGHYDGGVFHRTEYHEPAGPCVRGRRRA